MTTGRYRLSTGVLSGTPTAAGTFTFVVTANNTVDPPATQTFTLKIGDVTPTPTPTPTPTTPGNSGGTASHVGHLPIVSG